MPVIVLGVVAVVAIVAMKTKGGKFKFGGGGFEGEIDIDD
jgi:hypothetical protein